MRLNRTVHLNTIHRFGTLREIAPDVQLGVLGPDGQPVDAADMKALVFVDEDGQADVFVLDEDGRQKLIEALTGGILVL